MRIATKKAIVANTIFLHERTGSWWLEERTGEETGVSEKREREAAQIENLGTCKANTRSAL